MRIQDNAFPGVETSVAHGSEGPLIHVVTLSSQRIQSKTKQTLFVLCSGILPDNVFKAPPFWNSVLLRLER